jgi:2-polyprenyl-3-methyl-5-hydroxy-6-metoxy-1,4-benzoquinol methylase
MPPLADTTLADYVTSLTAPAFIAFCARRSSLPVEDVGKRLTDYANEVSVGVDLLDGMLAPGTRVLDVGAGLGLLSVWLAARGTTVTLLEPGAGGFSANRLLLDAVLEWFDVRATVLPFGAEALDPDAHGRFDLICSVNVLEHIPALEAALTAMTGVLAPGGVMRHTCPNYAIPYEPHYEIPLIPFAPSLTASVVPRLNEHELWQSLNFITAGRVKRFCRAQNLECRFDGGLLSKAFDRIDQDRAFQQRRGRAVRHVQRVLKSTGLLALIRRLPPQWSTPMAFTCWRRNERPL